MFDQGPPPVVMEHEQHVILETFLGRLLALKDSDFAAFLNSDNNTIKIFINNLALFWSHSNTLNTSCHVKFFKFLLRLCPSYNSRIDLASSKTAFKAIIAPKKFIDALFETDPVGLMTYLFVTWHTSSPELLQIIRDDLFPSSLTNQLKQAAHKSLSPQVIAFLEWSCGTKITPADLSLRERESILQRFEYDSDDDMVDENECGDADSACAKKSILLDPVQNMLLSKYISDPAVFARTSASRLSKPRKALCEQTKLSHEQIEGWALMLERNPKKTRIIQDFIIATGNTNK